MAMGMMPMPSASSMNPKLKRGVPISGSQPTVESSRPRHVAMRPRQGLPEAARLMMTRENSRIMLYSGGPMRRAMEATGAARNMSTRSLAVSAVTEANRAVLSALPLFPFFASGYPSNVVIMACGVPGMLNRMAGMEPPKLAPLDRPMSMAMPGMGPR